MDLCYQMVVAPSMACARLPLLKSSKWNTTELISNVDLFQPHLKYTLTFFHTSTSRSRTFITTLFHSSVHFFLVLVKGLYQTESYSLHVMQLINTHLNHRRIFLFSTPCGVVSLLCMRTINCKPHWLTICCLSRIFFSRSTVQKLKNNMMNIVYQSCKQ